jgi:hypothetical protein
MISARVFKNLDGVEQTPLPLMARLYKLIAGTGKVPLTAADVSAVTLAVQRWNPVNGNSSSTFNQTVSPTFFSTLQVDTNWTKDLLGYNFAFIIPASAFPGRGSYSWVFSFTPVGSNFTIEPFVGKSNMVSLQGTVVEG